MSSETGSELRDAQAATPEPAPDAGAAVTGGTPATDGGVGLPPDYLITQFEQDVTEGCDTGIAEQNVAETAAGTLVELGCGLSEKTRVLLDAFGRSGDLRRFLPFDVDGDVLRMAADELLERYPGL